MAYLGGGAGIFALGSVAGLAANQLIVWVALFGLPSLFLAGLALVFAALARRPFVAAYPPSAAGALERAKLMPTAGEAEASLISVWHLATSLLQYATNKKAGWVVSATWMFVAAVACLILPVAAALAEKFSPGCIGRLFT
jgi:hypothetical protein